MKKITPITQEQWEQCNEFNRNIVDEFLNNSPNLSEQSKKVYRSNLMIWFNWVRESAGNKSQLELTPVDYMCFQAWVISMGHGLPDVRNKRAVISSLCNYIEEHYAEQYPQFRTCIAKGIR